LAPVPPELRQDPAALAQERPHVVVFAVGGVEPGPGGVVRDVHVPHRAVAARRGGDDELLDEGPVPLEDLDAVVATVADIEEPVPGEPDAVDRVAERLHARVARRATVGAPVALVGARLGIENDDAVVLVSVRHEDLVRRGIHSVVGRAPEVSGVSVAAGHTRKADLELVLTDPSSLHQLSIPDAVTNDSAGTMVVRNA